MAEARREKPLSYPRPGWVEQDRRKCWTPSCRAVGELLASADGPVTACGLDHQGESVLAWAADSGRPLTPVVTWQDKRSQDVLDALEREGRAERVRRRAGCRSTPTSRPASSPGCSNTTSGVQRALDQGTLRIGTVDSFLSARLGAGFATDPSTASRTQLGAPQWDPELLEFFGVPARVLPAIADTCRRPRRLCASSWTGELPLRRAVRRPAGRAGGCRVRASRVCQATYGRACSCSRTPVMSGPFRAGLLPTIAWRSTGSSSGRSTAACSRPGRCSTGSPAIWARRRPRGARRGAEAC